MKKIGITLLLSLTIGTLFSQTSSKEVTLKEITAGAFNQKSSTGEMCSLPDGAHYTAMNAERNMIIKYAYRTGNAVDTLFNTQTARECNFDTFQGYMISATGHRILVWRDTEQIYRRSWKANIFDFDVRRNYVKPLTQSKSKQMIPTFSPDGRMCAYVRDNNIWIAKFDFNTETQVTTDGVPNKILNGITDWVYEEEFSVTNLMSWSEDSEHLAFVRFDESDVKEFKMQTFDGSLYPDFYKYKYPKAGEKNSDVTLHAYSVETKDIKTLKLPSDDACYIPMIKFTKNPEQLAVMTLNRHQNVFNMYYANPKSTVFRLILREENACYVDSELLKHIEFTPAGFTYLSEKDGYTHIYQYSNTGVMKRQVTKGNWDVTAYLGTDPATKAVYYQAAEESPISRAVYKMDVKGKKTKLSTLPGTNSASFNADFTYYTNRNSSAQSPLLIAVHDAKNKQVRVLEDNNALRNKLTDYSLAKKEFIKLHTASDIELNASILKPANFDSNKKYPVLMVQYSGPNSQQVLDSYGFDWAQHLAANGIIVVSVDGRGTGARGEEFRKCTYQRMGLLESQDQVEAAQALGKLPYIDAKRIAIYGWSFGGYCTLMSMSTGNGTFKAGIAVAPPTDWRFYDTVYTERFMRTPNENFEGYKSTSPIQLAGQLEGKLLLVHGTADDNVHVQNSMDYAEALVQANKQFDMHIYTNRNHSIYGGNTRYHLFTKLSNFLFDNL